MSLKQKALLQLAALIGIIFASAHVVDFVVNNFDKDTIINVISFGCLGGLFYMMYGLLLTRLEMQESAKKLSESISKKA